MLLLAHRGASADAPENTLAAFELAVEQGADGVELDVQLCATGEAVVCHDERLDRLAGVPWSVRHTPYVRLRRADVGTPLGFASARIPLLADVFELLPERMLVNVELKCETVDDFGLTRAAVDVIRQMRAAERVVVSSFNPLCLVRLAELAPQLRRGFLIDPDKPFALHGALITPLVSTYSVHPHFSQVTEPRMRRWRECGLKTAVWTVDQEAEAKRLGALGVDYLITNRPAQIRRALDGSAHPE